FYCMSGSWILLSFPTRRSSVLGVLEPLARRHQLDERRDELERVEVTRDDDRLEPLCLGLPCEGTDDIVGFEPGERVHRNAERLEDRKSTRLNSSHEWISYAVFC